MLYIVQMVRNKTKNVWEFGDFQTPINLALEATNVVNKQPAREFLESMIFWSDKRPITIELLKRLNLRTLAQVLGQEEEYNGYALRNYHHNTVQLEASLPEDPPNPP